MMIHGLGFIVEGLGLLGLSLDLSASIWQDENLSE